MRRAAPAPGSGSEQFPLSPLRGEGVRGRGGLGLGGEGDFLAAKTLGVRQRRALEAPTDAALEALRLQAVALPPAPSLREALCSGECVALLAEFKRRSPSGGALTPDESPVQVAELYAACGARGVSVLTDAEDFGGSMEDLRAVAQAVALPVLRKDFLLDAADLYEARRAGASAALLIVGMMAGEELESLLRAAAEVALECLVEVHDEEELERALAAGAELIGINNRDLRRLTTDLGVTERLARRVPPGITLVSESGIRTPEDVARVRDAGAHAVLVGEALLRHPAGAQREQVRALAAVPR